MSASSASSSSSRSALCHEQGITIEAEDGFPLSAHVFQPHPPTSYEAEGEAPFSSLLVIVPATGVQSRFYHDFCRFAASNPSHPSSASASSGASSGGGGQRVLAFTFDYRYSGQSFPAHHAALLSAARAQGGDEGEAAYDAAYDAALRSCPSSEDLTGSWARKDLCAVVLHARAYALQLLRGDVQKAQNVPLTIMGHSLGGHLHCLLEPEFVQAPPYADVGSTSRSSSDSQARTEQGEGAGALARALPQRVTRFMTICSGNAHWRNHPTPDAARFAMRELVGRPLREERIFRCVNLGLGFDLPEGPGKEWLEWYMCPLFSLARRDNERRARENTRTTPFGYFGFEDDESLGA